MIFVSYSWVGNKPDEKVLSLVETLRKNGYDATCDVKFIQERTSINFLEMMSVCMQEAEKVIIVLSEQYKVKADLYKGGVGDEYRYILNDIDRKKNKYILVSFHDNFANIVPNFLERREIICLNSGYGFNELYLRIEGKGGYIFSSVNPNKTSPNQTKISEISSPKLLNVSEHLEDKYKKAVISVNNAKRERKLGNIRKSLDYYAQAEKIYREIDDNLRLTEILMSMSISENILENNCDKAKEYLFEVRRIFAETGEYRDYRILSKIGSISSRWGMYDDARTYFRRAEEGCINNKDMRSLADIYRLMGLLEGKPKLKKLNVAKDYLEKSNSIFFSLDDLDGQAKVFQAHGDIERLHKNYISAAKMYEKAYSIYVGLNDLSQQSVLLGELYRVCVRMDDVNSARKWEREIKMLYELIPEDIRVYIDDCLKETINVPKNA